MSTLKRFAFLLIILSLLGGIVSAQDSQFLEVWDQWEFYGMTAAGPALEVSMRPGMRSIPMSSWTARSSAAAGPFVTRSSWL